ncbi:MAG TPA: Crp/Fnr family transcriptional regulator [Brevundimonas sp.]|nr:Crp/Fnr family transcriptional regulator [Brevundimonas sp.]
MFRNHTLAAMTPEDMADLAPYLSEVSGVRGEVLNRQGYRVDSLYFPVSAYLANTVRFKDGQSTLTFVMGSEGVAGLAPFLADDVSAWGVEVRAPGAMYRLPASIMRRQMEKSPELRRQLMRLSYDYQAQASYGVGCASLHLATARVATLILRSADRLECDVLHLTQEDIAEFLGMQRTTANAAAKLLKHAGAILYRRGKIQIASRDALRAATCECYEATAQMAAMASAGADRVPELLLAG